MTLYEKITDLREKLGISQSELERRAGLGKGTITKWKSGTPNFESAKKVAEVLGCSSGYLLDEKSENNYYLNEETAKLAQEMYEDEDMRSLFDMKRNMPPERFKAHMEFMRNLYEQEKASM